MENRTLGNKYHIIDRLGRGGTAEVYRAHHINLERNVAIKILHDFLADDPEFKVRFEKEARNVARLKHPNIIQVYDFEFDPDSESYYMVMELIDGINLRDRLKDIEGNGRIIDLSETLRIIRQSASALEYAHNADIIHRDVKPANLLLDKTDHNRVVLTDFGIAKMITNAQHTITGGIIGTPAYMAPEQGIGDIGDNRADLYSLGVILFQMMTGKLPYEAEAPLALILKHLNDPIPIASTRNPRLTRQIDVIINKLLAKSPEDRYQTASQLIADIDNITNSIENNQKNTRSSRQATSNTILQSEGKTSQINPPPPLSQPKELTRSSETFDEPNSQTLSPTDTTSANSNRLWLWAMGILGVGVILIGGYVIGAGSGMRSTIGFFVDNTPSEISNRATTTAIPMLVPSTKAVIIAEETHVSNLTKIFTPTATTTAPATATPIPTDTPEPTPNIPTETAQPSPTNSATPDMTATIAQQRTATFSVCHFDYGIIQQTPEDGDNGGFFPINTDYIRTITLLNTGTCPWEINTSLTFINGSGESYDAGPRVFIREVVDVGQEYDLLFEGKLPAHGRTTPYTGQWQLKTPGQLLIGEPITISVMVYDPG